MKFLLPLLTAMTLYSASTTCSNIYLDNTAPDFINTKLSAKTQELCYKEFAVEHSGVSRTPLWSAEHLTRNNLNGKAERSNEFHAEARLSSDVRAELNDYAHSGYDRGHMSPSADFVDPQSNNECFTLANMVPQNHNNNAGIWAAIEGATRFIAKKQGEAYVITGPIFDGAKIERTNGRVFIPTKLFKAIYVPSFNQAAAYITNNAPGNTYQVVSIAELEKLTDINLFPKLSQDVKNHAMNLPVPKGSHSKETYTSGTLSQTTATETAQPQQRSNGFFDKLERKIHNFNKGY
ncbi:MAG: DNA/RNA non-specific endonuclease [Thiovulaceae bacterium]|nr:DNA/RNA non-specific endonuclease [Sulfurimonadaceae bacterium]